jgi:hypothetical protein
MRPIRLATSICMSVMLAQAFAAVGDSAVHQSQNIDNLDGLGSNTSSDLDIVLEDLLDVNVPLDSQGKSNSVPKGKRRRRRRPRPIFSWPRKG